MNFEWDPRKAASNLRDHGVSFEEAATIFDNPLTEALPDLTHSIEEDRFFAFGESERERLLAVIFIESGETIRIISAREATRKERRSYETQSDLS